MGETGCLGNRIARERRCSPTCMSEGRRPADPRSDERSTMSRIPLVRIEDMDPEQRAQYDRFPANLTRGLLLADQRLSQALPNLANALRAAPLDAKTREAVILRVAALHASAYERMQHLEQAGKVGWSQAEIAAIEAGRFDALPAETAVVLRFADECVTPGNVSDETFAAAQAVLKPRDLATVILLVGHYMMVARFTAVLAIELDPQADSWTHEH